VRLFDDLGSKPARPVHGRVEVVDLKPQEDATMPGRRGVRIDEIGMVLLVPGSS
jgi:hypothetical protein